MCSFYLIKIHLHCFFSSPFYFSHAPSTMCSLCKPWHTSSGTRGGRLSLPRGELEAVADVDKAFRKENRKPSSCFLKGKEKDPKAQVSLGSLLSVVQEAPELEERCRTKPLTSWLEIVRKTKMKSALTVVFLGYQVFNTPLYKLCL